MKRVLCAVAVVMLLVSGFVVTLTSCGGGESEFELGLPDLSGGEWSETLSTDFRGLKSLEGTPWSPMSPHGKRKYEYWCSDMLSLGADGLTIKSIYSEDYECSEGICPAKGVFTGGIETRVLESSTDESGVESSKQVFPFSQAFGYYEATVKVPRGTGMWSAFWLQSPNTGNIGHGGRDGAEIDVYESSFGGKNPTKTGSCIHYDAYDTIYYRNTGNVADVGYSLYDGEFHTYSLLWTPDRYVFFVDGRETWRTAAGGVSVTPEYMKLTVEIRDDVYGPYGQKIGKFENHDGGTNDFVIQSVKVYQNEKYLPYAKGLDDFDSKKSLFDNLVITFGVFGGLALCLTVFGVTRRIIKKRRQR